MVGDALILKGYFYMKLKSGLLIAITAVFGLSISIGANGTSAQRQPFRAIAVLSEGAPAAEVLDRVDQAGGTVEKEVYGMDAYVVNLPSQARVPFLESDAGIARVEEDIRVSVNRPPGSCTPWPDCKNGDDGSGGTDPAPEQTDWGVDRIDADLTWSASTGSGVNVAVIDTGLDKDHPGLTSNIAGGVNFVAPTKGPQWKRVVNPNDWEDDNGHGTHVGGTIAEAGDEAGYIGVAHDASLYGVKVLDKDGSGYLSDVVSGINWSIDNGMDVINMSLGASSGTQSLQDAVDNAYAAGITVVASAGNEGDGNASTNEVGYPAKYDSVIAVAATDSNDGTPYWSSEGSEVEIAAPGVNITSSWNDGKYNTISGTSMASPHVAGVVSLMLANDGQLTPDDVRTTLSTTADDLGATGFDNHYGWGLVDAEEAVTGVQTN